VSVLCLLTAFTILACRAYAEVPTHHFALPVLTTCRAAHDISLERAARGYPIHLRGVVTFYDAYLDPRHAALFVHDATGSIFMALPSRPVLALKAGTLIDVEGISGNADYAPVILNPKVKAIGTGPLPLTAPRPTMAELLSGRQDGQWVEIEGIVQAVQKEPKIVTFQIATVGGTISAAGPLELGVGYERFIDAVVQIRGNAVPVFNGNRQMVGARLLFPSVQQLKVLTAANIDPYAASIVSVARLLQFVPGVVLRHRSHIRGVVTLHWPGRLLCIQESSRGLCMLSDHQEQLHVGDMVDVIGFPAVKDFKPTLDNNALQVVGGGVALSATQVTIEQAIHGEHDQELVQIEGELIGQDRATGDLTLELRSGHFLYSAVLPTANVDAALLHWKEGSAVRVTGICEVLMDPRTSGNGSGALQPYSARILLRAAGDVTILQAPPWWTRERVLALLALVGLVALGAVTWGVALRRKVKQQTDAIRQSEERLRHLSQHDVLTGLPNRFLLNDRLEMALKQSARTGRVVGILMIDLDRFKEINDNMGHRVGDLVLREVAARLARAIRASDTVARLGGDEFIVVLPDLHDASEAELVAAKVVQLMDEPISINQELIKISASIGVGCSAQDSPDPEHLLHEVDAAMYQAKRCGRNRYQFCDYQTKQWSPSERHRITTPS
jgi:diguanylate cyclase (GGDEF)-like protein